MRVGVCAWESAMGIHTPGTSSHPPLIFSGGASFWLGRGWESLVSVGGRSVSARLIVLYAIEG